MSPKIQDLCAPLDSILRSELDLGNEIGEIQRNLWSEMDLVICLKLPFHRKYPAAKGIRFHRNTDTHYSLNDTYSSAEHRQAVEAPY